MQASQTSMESVIEVRDLTKRFGGHVAVDGLDLVVARGQCLGLLGPNGAGKSTTVRILSTLLRPTAGTVRVLGLDPVEGGSALRHRIGVVPQELALYEHLTGAENLAFFGRLYGLRGAELEAAVERGLTLSGLKERAGDRVKAYSGGMKRRLNIALALVHRPELVFLDEPTVGIDPQSRNRIFDVVDTLRGEGTSILYTSHQLGEIERLCDRIVILDHGRKVAEGSLAELQRLDAVAKAGTASLRFATVSEARTAVEALAASGLAADVHEEMPGLEEVFLALTGRELRDGGVA